MYATPPERSAFEFAPGQQIATPPATTVATRAGGSIENPAVSLNDADDIWSDVFRSASGAGVSPQTAMRLAPFWQAVNLISGDIAKLPLEVFVRDGRDREPDPTHPAYALVRDTPNESQTAFEFWQDFVAHLLVWRNAYAVIVRSPSGRPLQLLPLLPDRTGPEVIKGKRWYVSEIDGKLQLFDPWEILHVRGVSFDGEAGLELCDYARDVIGRALARQNLQSKFYDRGGRIGGILELPAGMPKPIQDKVEGSFREKYESADAAFQTVVLKDSAKFHAAQSSWKDAQLLEASQEDVREVARLFNCPPHKLGDMTRSSYSSLEQENRSYYDSCLSPWLVAIKQGCDRKLRTPECRAARCHFFDYNVGALTWADLTTLSAIANTAIMNGSLRRNEYRRWLNLPSGGPELDKFLVPVNMRPAGQGGDGDPSDPADDPPTDPPTPPADPPENDRQRPRPPCYREWMVNPARRDAPSMDTAGVRSAIDAMEADATVRLVNRLRTAAARQCKNAPAWESFLTSGLASHVEVGRSMFAPTCTARAAIGLPPVDFAGGVAERFAAAAKALPLPVTAAAVEALLSD